MLSSNLNAKYFVLCLIIYSLISDKDLDAEIFLWIVITIPQFNKFHQYFQKYYV